MKRAILFLILILSACILFSVTPVQAESVTDSMSSETDDGRSTGNLHILVPPSHSSGSGKGVQTSVLVPFHAMVSKPVANLRAYASSRAGLIEVLTPGEQVLVIGQTTGSDGKVWYQVEFGSRIGYIRYDRLEVQCGTADFGGTIAPVPLCLGQTNTRAVNVRLGMSIYTERVRLLRRGQTVTLIGLARDAFGVPWYYVKVPTGAIGYIRGEFITVISGSVPESVPLPPAPAQDETPYPTGLDTLDEEVIYLRWLNAHMELFQEIGNGYQGYSLFDLDGDGIREILVNCSTAQYSLWQVYTCNAEEEVTDLGQLAASGYYLAGEGSGMLLVQVLSDTQTQYAKIMKVGDSLVPMYSLVRTANEAWEYSWTYNQKPITDDSLRMLLKDFSDDVLQNMGIYRGNDEIIPNTVPDDSQING